MNIIAGSRCFQQKHNAEANGFPSFVFSGPGRKNGGNVRGGGTSMV